MTVNRKERGPAPVVLSIAGFDPSSGAGITADIKTIAAHGCYGATCITALTVQTTQGVRAVEAVKAGDCPRHAPGTRGGPLFQRRPHWHARLGSGGGGRLEFLESTRPPNVVLDPVVRSSSGAELLEPAGVALLRRRLLPLVSVVTPNIDEVAVLSGALAVGPPQAAPGLLDPTAEPRLRTAVAAAEALLNSGVGAAVVTGGHLETPTDVLLWREQGILQVRVFPSRKIESRSTHGTGCAFATSLACSLALGISLPEGVARAQQYVFRAIETAEPLGRGIGPINHLWPLQERL